MPKPSVSATRLAGSAPVAVTVAPGRTPPSGPTIRPSMAPVVVWALAAAAAASTAADNRRPIAPRRLVHIPHLLQEIAACRPCLARAEGAGAASGSLEASDGTGETITRRWKRSRLRARRRRDLGGRERRWSGRGAPGVSAAARGWGRGRILLGLLG